MLNTEHASSTPLWRRWLAYSYYAWGLSLSQWGLHTANRSFYDAAIRSFDRAVAVWPAFAMAYFRRAIIYSRELGQHNQGLEDLARAIASAPEHAIFYLHRGLILRFHGDPREAAADLRHFIALDPASPWRAEADRQLAQLESV